MSILRSQFSLPEDAVQRAIVAQFQARAHPAAVLAAIPNGEWRHKATAGRLKALGVLPGFPDLFAAGAHGWGLIELKKQPARQRDAEKDLSDTQKDLIPKLRALGIQVPVLNDIDAVIATLEAWGVLRGRSWR